VGRDVPRLRGNLNASSRSAGKPSNKFLVGGMPRSRSLRFYADLLVECPATRRSANIRHALIRVIHRESIPLLLCSITHAYSDKALDLQEEPGCTVG